MKTCDLLNVEARDNAGGDAFVLHYPPYMSRYKRGTFDLHADKSVQKIAMALHMVDEESLARRMGKRYSARAKQYGAYLGYDFIPNETEIRKKTVDLLNVVSRAVIPHDAEQFYTQGIVSIILVDHKKRLEEHKAAGLPVWEETLPKYEYTIGVKFTFPDGAIIREENEFLLHEGVTPTAYQEYDKEYGVGRCRT